MLGTLPLVTFTEIGFTVALGGAARHHHRQVRAGDRA
jgi:hypothetical protein